ncbi:MAG: Fe-S protein assembly chaperone HscA [Rickettsiaceae bacterium]|nr:MAG: Fe-S protein assembly chaperone HscA [Rickettsiaceae bacterium]
MQLLEIKEPDANKFSSLSENHIAVGIDFGTTNSLIAISKNKKIRTIFDINGRDLIPSAIRCNDKGKITVDTSSDDKNFIFSSIKRFLGKSSDEIRNNLVLSSKASSFINLEQKIPRLIINDQTISMPEAAAEIFKYLKFQAETDLGQTVDRAVITVPAYFDDAAKGAVLLAAKIAGFEVLRILAEPTAAAYAYGLNMNASGHYLVYDLGGGTFDVSVLYIKEGVFQVIATGGDNMIGGDDVDHIITQHFQDLYKIDYHCAVKIAKNAKEELSSKQVFKKLLDIGINVELSRKSLENLILPLIKRTIDIVNDTIEHASSPILNGIITVGGSTRIPLINQLLRKNFNNIIYEDIDPDRAVVWGAALQAENLTSTNPDSLIIDVVSLSIGLELYGGLIEKIILRNSPLPLTVTREFTTYADDQTAMQFNIFQGEREMVRDCRPLAHFELQGIPPMQSGTARIEVTFSLDINGILSVLALEKISGKSQIVVMNPSYGIGAIEVEEILNNAYKNAYKDHEEKILLEKIFKAQSLIDNLKSSLSVTFDDNIIDENNELLQAIISVEIAITSKDRNLINTTTEDLEILATDFNNKQLNKLTTKLLKGKNINEI